MRKKLVENLRRLRDALFELWALDSVVRVVVLGFVAFELLGVLWDQPGFYGWENDGAAPRDFLEGIARNLTPGKAHRYPLFHYLLLGLLALPVLVVDALLAWVTGNPVPETVVSVPSMTVIAVATKLLHLAMTCVSLLVSARLWRTLFGELAARWAVLFTAANLSVAYYGRVTNVDTAYLMWVVLATERLLWIAKDGAPKHYRLFAFFVAAGLATKDQAYASFVLVGPLTLLWLPLNKGHAFAAGKLHYRRLWGAALLGAFFYALLSGALFNPTGFVTRVQMLAGTNSQDWKQYDSSLSGVWLNLRDLIRLQDEFWWPLPVVVTAWLGALFAPRLRPARPPPAPLGHWLWPWLPLVAGISNTLAFTLVVARSEHRFMLVLGFWLGGYAGVAVAALIRRCSESRHPAQATRAAVGVGALLFGLALAQNIELLVTQWSDPRRSVERFLSALPARTRVETYGLGVYLPRFDLSADSTYQTTRLGSASWGKAPLIAGMVEAQGNFQAIETRRPDVIVLPEGFASRFRDRNGSGAMDKYRAAPGALQHFPRLMANRLPGYHLISVGQLEPPGWFEALGGRLLEVHGSTGRPVWVLVRDGFALGHEEVPVD